ncbi:MULTISPECIES: aspartate kinase [unclassified Thermosynechococcus]|uniref:aspartate kinase n=1 Tax=unclassified Thermosynechococcus TaxID=2622553 RepID=UPI00197E7556|nr:MULTISPECIES: aspartate kinase [unclassified Thermosynechococcus]MDR5640184.1 aspartate kinase [Thermosynechococcus sp. PP42]MDR7897389.1 aspartate kinase [Thermosynechococcus sp. JY1332]MDR7904794.1 aspartate kinase [Thermosynechococcus sp. JY1334]MDR7922972.1 aspartate kinase [Thermosynechococcus sp. HY213]MDR7992617.1 aspartate kinase [Thermosynechococcus sp. TG252]
MGLIVQKYGGTSVGSVERIQAVARRVKATVAAGHQVVVVVSAMGKTTDSLVQLAYAISDRPSQREMDMLLSTGEQVSIALLTMALHALGEPAISLTGAQVGIVTEPAHTRARILHIETQRLERHLKEGQVVVVAGFQGITAAADFEVTTLGRGGSDTSAVALAAALRADCCEIYTDVPGILTTDPRLVPNAQLMSEITCDEMLELASLGAKVLHPRAVEIARNYGVDLVVRSSWTDDPGTRVIAPSRPPRPVENLELGKPVDGVALDTDQAKVALLRVADRPGVAAQLFGELARQNLDVDLIIQSIHEGQTNDIAFTVQKRVLKQAEAVAVAFYPRLNPRVEETDVLVDADIAKVSITGAGMIGRPGVAAQMFSALAAAGINLQMISTSEVNVSCTVAAADAGRAIAVLSQTFDVEAATTVPQETPDAPAVRGVALDPKQARIAIRDVPDRPGMAAAIFQTLADAAISVDMIIQSQRSRSLGGVMTRDIAFTVASADAERATELLKGVQSQLGYGDILIDTAIAKVSIVGVGMIHRPGIAAQMFAALARENINIQMIATSEIRVSCVVAESEGVRALRAVHTAFGLDGEAPVVIPDVGK